MEILLKAAYILVVIINFSVGILVLVKNYKKGSNLTFFLLTLTLNGWVISNYLAYTGTENIAQVGGQASFMFGALIVPMFMIFVYYFPKKSNFHLNYLLLLFIPAVIFSYFSFSPAFIK